MKYIDKIIDSIDISRNWKVFVFNIVAIFLMVVLQHMQLQPPQFMTTVQSMINPIPNKIEESVKSIDVFDSILPKLQQKENTFELKKATSLIPQVHASIPSDEVASYAVVNLDSGEVLASKNLSDRLPMASLTKVMTAVVALDLSSEDELFTVSQKAQDMIPTKIGVITGEKMSLEELLGAALLTSANDAVEVIKEGINKKYTADIFIRAMNAKAKFLGLENTNFQNPQGFDGKEHFSSSEDMIVLSQYALENYPTIKEIVKKESDFLKKDLNHKQFDLPNWNGLVGVYPGTYGVKIGQTGKAGKTTIVFSEREGKRVGVVVLGAAGVLERDMYASELLDLGFSKLNISPVNISELQFRAKYKSWNY